MENSYNLPNIKQVMAEELARRVLVEVIDGDLPDNVIPFPIRTEPEDICA